MNTNPNMDQDLYSRQIASFGITAMQKIVGMNVFIQGLRGLGIETAKNVILAGPKSVVIYDSEKISIRDLGTNYYLTEDDIQKGLTRAEACLYHLKGLNPYVEVKIHKGEIKESDFDSFDVITFTNFWDVDKLISYNTYCRTRPSPIGFIYAGCLGLAGFIFNDFGDLFHSFDTNGLKPYSEHIMYISNEEEAHITTINPHGLIEGDLIKITEVEGITDLNEKIVKVVKYIDGTNFTIDVDTRSAPKYRGKGLIQTHTKREDFKFRDLKSALDHPLAQGYPKINEILPGSIAQQLHNSLRAILTFYKDNNRLPSVNDDNDANSVLALAQKINQELSLDIEGKIRLKEVKKDIVKNYSLFANTQFIWLTSFFGGILAQEILKKTGKYTPIRQWLHYELFSLLKSDKVNRKIRGCRYDDQIAIFGQEFQDQIADQNILVVGAGAVGCELLKNFAMAGFSVGKGKLTCTDDDNIQNSNLNRQFLFRPGDLNKSKSVTAINAVKKMNPNFNGVTKELRILPEYNEEFSDEFWESLDFVANAVDSFDARVTVDGKCCFYRKPFFDCGTEGTNANTFISLPKLTGTFSDKEKSMKNDFAFCTLKSFPYQIEHTIAWAREDFESRFNLLINDLIKLQTNRTIVEEELRREEKSVQLKKIEVFIKIEQILKNQNQTSCIEFARDIFDELFDHDIQNLTLSLPEKDKDGNLNVFWSGVHRFPTPLKFDIKDQMMFEFIKSAANLIARTVNIGEIKDDSLITSTIENMIIIDFVPERKFFETGNKDHDLEESQIYDQKLDEKLKSLWKLFEALKPSQSDLSPQIFEKDDEKNYHIDYISSVANLRARNYRIPNISRLEVKVISGNITPALATTTAAIVGVIGFEIVKYILISELEDFNIITLNLAIPKFMTLSLDCMNPLQPKTNDNVKKLIAKPSGFSQWDIVEIKASKTIKELIDFITKTYDFIVGFIKIEKFAFDSEDETIFEKKIEDIYAERKKIFPGQKYIECSVSGIIIIKGEEDPWNVIFPRIKYIL
jgi:ubiquitin-activating enzyme E1